MANVPNRVASRIASGIKKFQPILTAAKARDVNESDTVLILTDILQDVLGYDKYSEITSEHAIRGTYCDLAMKLEGEVQLLLEAKAIGLELKDAYVKQAIDYAANQGMDWVVLTNGINWRTYKVAFSKPIEAELVFEFNFCDLNPKSEDHVSMVYLLAKEGWQKSSLGAYHSQRQVLNRFSISALLLSEPVLNTVRKELKQISGGVKISSDEIREVIMQEVLKREVLEGEKAELARKQVAKAMGKSARTSRAPKEHKELPVERPAEQERPQGEDQG